MKRWIHIAAAVSLLLNAELAGAQCSALLHVRNIQLRGNRLQWDVHFQPGGGWDTQGDCGLGSSSWFFHSTHNNLSAPQISYKAGFLNSENGYTTAIGLYRDRVGLSVILDDAHYSGEGLHADSLYHLFTLEVEIDGSMEAELLWDRINTGIYDSRGRFIREYYMDGGTTLPGEDTDLPEAWTLSPNFPNPFNPDTAVLYGIPESSNVTLAVFDITGREVNTLYQGMRPPGYYLASWDGCDKYGRKMPAGIYILKMHVGDFSTAIRMALVK